MNYVDSLNLFGVKAKEIPCVKGSGAPTTSTTGAVGMLYMNIDNGDMYKCIAENNEVYTWESIGAANNKGEYIEKTVTVMTMISNFTLSSAYINRNGIVVDHVSYCTTEMIPVLPDTKITYDGLQAIVGYSCVIAFYDDTYKFIYGIYYNEDDEHDSGTGAIISGECVVPSNAAYFRVSTYNDIKAISKSIQYSKIERVYDDNMQHTHWYSKNWVAFGTSITSITSGYYTAPLAELSGLVLNNCGIDGGTIAIEGKNGGSGGILTKIKNTDISNADLITIEGFVNDFACSVELGNPGDIENNTFYGALYQAIKYCLEHSSATVVLLTETTGRYIESTGADYTIFRENGIGLTQNDYNDAIVKMAHFMGVHVIDAGRKSQVNEFRPDTLSDHIHHSELGGKQYANTIWDELKNIHAYSAIE